MKVFITGGAGFIGCNLAHHHLTLGNHVAIFDNFSRPGSHHNLDWLRAHPAATSSLDVQVGDIRDFEALHTSVTEAQPDLIIHLAAQTAVTTSILNPREDFEINAMGTFYVLESARSQARKPAVFYASTNKVYGALEDVPTTEDANRYRLTDLPDGVNEIQSLDFHSPYGCSKGAGDQYMRDYARIFGLRTVVFRQSCVYGPRQFGVEDQGWVAHFLISAALNRPITVYGDGKQVRDLLHVQDLISAYDAAWRRIEITQGQIFNIGGGSGNTISVWAEFRPWLEELSGAEITVHYEDTRQGDQVSFVSDNTRAMEWLGWQPAIHYRLGVRELWEWINRNLELFS